MSDRWKYQVTMGSIWGVFMTVCSAVFATDKHPYAEQFRSPQLYVHLVLFLLTGIFILGYFTWKSKSKRENTK